jgi:hypothetical protein
MADFAGLAAAGRSVKNLLDVRFDEEQPLSDPTSVGLARAEDFESTNFAQFISRPAVTLFFYRVDFNKTMRASWSAVGAYDGRSRLALDMYFLLTAWAANAEEELRVLGRTMQVLEDTPIISGPLLAGNGGWAPDECLQVVLGDMDSETLLRLFETLRIGYRLSIPYIARVVRIDGLDVPREPPVVTALSRGRS